MKHLSIPVSIFTALLLVACASAPHREAMKIQPGMTKEEVIKVAGQPLDRNFVGAQEKWVFGSDEAGAPRKVVLFRSGKVVSLENETPATAGQSAAGGTVIPANGPIPDLPCADRNQFGSYAQGGGCNMYGCFPPGGYCNGFGCSAQGTCTNKGCPRKIDTYRCVE